MYVKDIKRDDETVITPVYTISAFNIHPSLLRNLIPVPTPSFRNLDNIVATVHTVEAILELDMDTDFSNDLYFLRKCVDLAIDNQMKYLYTIKVKVDTTNDIPIYKVFIRGA